jgi:MFS family permease
MRSLLKFIKSEPAFLIGAVILGLTHLGGGFVRNKIAMFVLRGIGGLGMSRLTMPYCRLLIFPSGGALTVPSALSMLVELFPEKEEQGKALTVYGVSAAVGNGTPSMFHLTPILDSQPLLFPVTGLIIGALFVQLASWHWVFWFVAVVALPMALACFFLIPDQANHQGREGERLDLVGVFMVTSESTLFPRSSSGR